MENKIHSITEFEHITGMQEDLHRKLAESQRKESAPTDTLRASVLALVVKENPDRAKEEMRHYVDFKKAYPEFQHRVERYVQHCEELIDAIQTKRNFPGLASLSLAKQQEIHERVVDHFEELKQHLRQIEKVEREQKLEDVRSTVWVLRSLCVAAVWIFGLALMIDIRDGAFNSAYVVTSQYLDSAASWMVNLFGH